MMKRLREPVSGLTHLAGVLLALVALGVLLAGAAGEGRVDSGQCFVTSPRSRNPKRSSQFGRRADVVQDTVRTVRLAGLAGAAAV